MTRILRVGLTALIVLDLMAVAAFAVHRTTTTTRSTRPAAGGGPVPAAGPKPSTPPVTVAALPPVAVAVPQPTTSSTPPSGGATSSTPTTQPPPASDVPAVKVAAIGKCPIRLATPKQMGGVQSLVSFAPAFGPWSAEAFAAAAAYQPELELLGPLLAQFPGYATQVEPLIGPVLSLFATGSNALFNAVAPLYAPHRPAVLAAETKLAAALAPYSAKLAGTPLAGCVVDLEAALVGDTSKQHK
jgi:hypothetical protein